MWTPKRTSSESHKLWQVVIQRRVNDRVDALRPHRWNWQALARPIDRSLQRDVSQPLAQDTVRNLRFFWLDGLFSAVSENFYLGYVTLFALAFGATNGQVGMVTAAGNLFGAISLFPGARLVERWGRRKPLILWSAGGLGRFVLLSLALVPFLTTQAELAIALIILLNGLRAFMGSLANPAWTALVADLVPDFLRGNYFSRRNFAMGLAALVVAPLAGQIINVGNEIAGFEFLGYQAVFLFAFLFGVISTLSFRRIDEPAPSDAALRPHQRGDLRRALRQNPAFVGLVISAFIWNMALQVAAPFFNVYLVAELGATTTMVGAVASVSSLTALFGQRYFGRWLDRKGTIWVIMVSGALIPGLPLAWIFITEPWHVGIINTFGGFLWAGYNLANFNLLLTLTPDEQRPRAVALFQTAVFSSSVVGPVLGGYLADVFSFQLIFLLSAAGRLLGTLALFWFTVRVLRNRAAKKVEDSAS
ncbi:MAG: MFS transporter [Chloroflexota bacterium]